MRSYDGTAEVVGAPNCDLGGSFDFEELRKNAHLKKRQWTSALFEKLCILTTVLAMSVLVVMIGKVLFTGASWLNWEFLTSYPSRFPRSAGIFSALVGSLWLLVLTALLAVPLGVGAAIYLEEFQREGLAKRLINTNIANLAGVPSIVYGMLGLTLFVRFLSLDRSVLAGASTLAILILPIIIIAAQESLRAVPQYVRHAAYAVGATKWQAVWHHVIPVAAPGILTGIILSVSRAIGETAPLILIGGLTYVAFVPEGPLDSFTALPIQIFNWAGRPQAEFHNLAAAGIIVLLTVLLLSNSLAIFLRNRYQRKNLCQLL